MKLLRIEQPVSVLLKRFLLGSNTLFSARIWFDIRKYRSATPYVLLTNATQLVQI